MINLNTQEILDELEKINPVYAGASKRVDLAKIVVKKIDENRYKDRFETVHTEKRKESIGVSEQSNIVSALSSWINGSLLELLIDKNMLKESIFNENSDDCKRALFTLPSPYRDKAFWVTGTEGYDIFLGKPVYCVPSIGKHFSFIINPRHALVIIIDSLEYDGTTLSFDFGMNFVHEQALIVV